MGERCIAAGYSNTNSDAVSLFHFPRDLSLRKKWNKQVQRTGADWKDATEYSVLCSDHFTSNSFEMDSFLAAGFGMAKKKHLKPDAIPMIFHRPTAATNPSDLQEGTSVCHKQSRIQEGESTVQKMKKAACEKREKARIKMVQCCIAMYVYSSYV